MKYRVVQRNADLYEVQQWAPWWPFWRVPFMGTRLATDYWFASLEGERLKIDEMRSKRATYHIIHSA